MHGGLGGGSGDKGKTDRVPEKTGLNQVGRAGEHRCMCPRTKIISPAAANLTVGTWPSTIASNCPITFAVNS